MRQLSEVAAGAHRCQLLSRWLQRWRLAVQRSHMLAAREHTRQEALLQRAWAGWRQHCREMQLRNALEVAAQVHREKVVLRQIVGGWRAHAAAQQQVEWPDDHPVLVKAAEVRRRRLLASVFQVRDEACLEHHEAQMPGAGACEQELAQHLQRHCFSAWGASAALLCLRPWISLSACTALCRPGRDGCWTTSSPSWPSSHWFGGTCSWGRSAGRGWHGVSTCSTAATGRCSRCASSWHRGLWLSSIGFVPAHEIIGHKVEKTVLWHVQ